MSTNDRRATTVYICSDCRLFGEFRLPAPPRVELKVHPPLKLKRCMVCETDIGVIRVTALPR